MGLFFDCLLKLLMFVTKPEMLDWVDEIEKEILELPGVTATIHKYGGLQLNYQQKEIGHIHSNGLLDMPLTMKLKNELMKDGRIQDHHSFRNTGWISFYIRSDNDRQYAVSLLKTGYQMRLKRRPLTTS